MEQYYSIVIISKNNRTNLNVILKSLFENLYNFDKIEIIVVEATDTNEDLEFKERIKHIKIPLNLAGFSFQRNLGILNASSNFIIFIDDDIKVTEKWFEALVSSFKEEKFGIMGAVFPEKENANFISFCIGVLGHPGGGFRLHYYSKGKPLELSQIATCNTLFRKDIIIDVGMFNIENKYGSEDSDLCLRIIQKYGTNRFLYVPDALVWHKTHKNLLKVIKWYVRRGKADIDLVLTDKLHIKYVFSTSLLLKFLLVFILSAVLSKPTIFWTFCFLWYIFQLYKHRYMWKYFKIYSFNFLYSIFTFFIFPTIKFIADISFDIGRILEIFHFIKQRFCK